MTAPEALTFVALPASVAYLLYRLGVLGFLVRALFGQVVIWGGLALAGAWMLGVLPGFG